MIAHIFNFISPLLRGDYAPKALSVISKEEHYPLLCTAAMSRARMLNLKDRSHALAKRVHLHHGTLLLLLMLCLWVPSFSLYAAPLSSSDPLLHLSIADIVMLYEREILALQTDISFVATRLLYGLCTISIVLTGINMIFLRNGTLQVFFFYIVKLILTIGFFQFLIINGFTLACDIINSMTSVAYHGQNTTGYVSILEILRDFFLLSEEFARSISTRNILFFLFFMIPFFVIIVILVVNFILNYMYAFFISAVGVLGVGFGAFPLTRGIAINFLYLVISSGLRLFTLCFIFRVGQNIIESMIFHLRCILGAGEVITIQDAGMVLFVLSIILAMSLVLPGRIVNLIRPINHTLSLSQPSPVVSNVLLKGTAPTPKS